MMEQNNDRPARVRRTNKQILQLLEEFEKSGLTVKDFSGLHHVSEGNFFKWKSRYGKRAVSKNNPSGFASIDIVHTTASGLPLLFAEVSGIKIYQPVSSSFLKELLA